MRACPQDSDGHELWPDSSNSTVDGSVVGSGVAEIDCVLSVDRGPSDHLMGHAF